MVSNMYVYRVLEQNIKDTFNKNKVLFLSGARQLGKTAWVNKIFNQH